MKKILVMIFVLLSVVFGGFVMGKAQYLNIDPSEWDLIIPVDSKGYAQYIQRGSGFYDKQLGVVGATIITTGRPVRNNFAGFPNAIGDYEEVCFYLRENNRNYTIAKVGYLYDGNMNIIQAVYNYRVNWWENYEASVSGAETVSAIISYLQVTNAL